MAVKSFIVQAPGLTIGRGERSSLSYQSVDKKEKSLKTDHLMTAMTPIINVIKLFFFVADDGKK
jgi:hypothetical protein